MRMVMGSQVNRLWLPAAASMGMATHAVNMDTDSTHRRSMTGPYSRREERPRGRLVRKRSRAPWASGLFTTKRKSQGFESVQDGLGVSSSSAAYRETVWLGQRNPTQPWCKLAASITVSILVSGSSVTRSPSPERSCGPLRCCTVTRRLTLLPLLPRQTAVMLWRKYQWQPQMEVTFSLGSEK